jgi:hypothetical protein
MDKSLAYVKAVSSIPGNFRSVESAQIPWKLAVPGCIVVTPGADFRSVSSAVLLSVTDNVQAPEQRSVVA